MWAVTCTDETDKPGEIYGTDNLMMLGTVISPRYLFETRDEAQDFLKVVLANCRRNGLKGAETWYEVRQATVMLELPE